jgi:N-acetylglucosamine-6-phosphate deacetylase
VNEIACVAGQPNDDAADHSVPRPIDLQVNGYGGIDFNGDPSSIEQIGQLCERLRRDGVGGILATVITAPIDHMEARVRAIVSAVESDPEIASMILGLHIEGPFINAQSGFVGAHPVAAVKPAQIKDCQRILDAGRGHVRLWTLAPEVDDGARVTRYLADQKVVVSGGHSDASIDQLRRAIDAGMTMFTHLGNGCPALQHRHDNIVQRVLSLSESLAISFIADGHHVPLFALANYLRCVPREHVVIVSDCMSATGLGPGTYRLGEQTVYVDAELAAWCEDRSHFAGSATSLVAMREILLSRLGISTDDWRQMAVVNPSRLLALR